MNLIWIRLLRICPEHYQQSILSPGASACLSFLQAKYTRQSSKVRLLLHRWLLPLLLRLPDFEWAAPPPLVASALWKHGQASHKHLEATMYMKVSNVSDTVSDYCWGKNRLHACRGRCDLSTTISKEMSSRTRRRSCPTSLPLTLADSLSEPHHI